MIINSIAELHHRLEKKEAEKKRWQEKATFYYDHLYALKANLVDTKRNLLKAADGIQSAINPELKGLMYKNLQNVAEGGMAPRQMIPTAVICCP